MGYLSDRCLYNDDLILKKTGDLSFKSGWIFNRTLETAWLNTDPNFWNDCNFISNFKLQRMNSQLEYIVIAAYHDLHHPGKLCTRYLIGSRFIWPKMADDISIFIKSCLKCQLNKHSRLPTLAIKSISQPDGRFKMIHADIIGPLTPDEAYILSVRDRFTKYLTLIPMKSVDTNNTINSFIHTYICRFGLPENRQWN